MNAHRMMTGARRSFLLFLLLGSLSLLFFAAGEHVYVRAEGEEATPSFTEESSPTPTVETATAEEVSETATFMPSATPFPIETLTETPRPTISTATPAAKIPVLGGDYVQDEVLVRFAPLAGDAQAAADACFVNEQVQVAFALDAVGASLLKINQGSVSEVVAQAENCPEILFAEPNYQLYALDTFPNDPSWSLQYGLTAIHAPQGWDTSTGSVAVVIAIIDTGVDLTHPDLAAKLVAGYDFVNNDAVPQDDNGHGTHVAGIAAALSNNGTGVSGVSWGARIMPVKVLNAGAGGTFANAAAGIIWAADHGAHIINLSLGGSSDSQVFHDAIDYAYNKGVMLIASSGNNGSGFILYPARYPNVMAVGATNSSNVLAGFSNYGAELDVVAPGVNIYSTGINSYYYNSGTSMAAPFVTGLASILRGIPGSGSPANLAWAIKSTALDLGAAGRDNYYGDGLIQMDAAIQLLWVPPTSTPKPQIAPTEQTWLWQVSVTPTSSPTPTLTLTLSPTVTVVFSPVSPSATSDESEAELFALATPTENLLVDKKRSDLETYFPLCLGSLFIFAGLFLFIFARRVKGRRPRI